MIYLSILGATFFINVDGGIFPAAVLKIEEDLEISEQEVAILNGVNLVFCGTLSIFAGPIFNNYNARSVLVFTGICSSVSWFIFLVSTDFNVLVGARALNGSATAMICAYMPVWINEFSPLRSQTLWMGCY